MEENENNAEKQSEIGATESRLLEAMSLPQSAAEALSEENIVPQEYSAFAGEKLAQNKTKAKMYDIIETLKTVSDPEIPINIYDMGLIYKIDQKDDGDIYLEMTLTAPTCPIAGVIPQQVADTLSGLEGTGKIEVRLVWEPAWTPDKLTDDAKEMLELL
ncbi:MAG: DUF59 domain-containing protein [Alphaproteobacteria bacterium]|nr:DUF59 domain-containing protein [Alphaproteobacteria bacterium]